MIKELRPRWQQKSRVRKESRTIKLPGEEPDGGALYRCWNCGQTCDEDRDALGDGHSGSGAVYLDYTVEAPGAEPGIPESAFAVMSGILHVMVALPSDASGNPSLEPHIHVTTGTGCPLCHTLNWRGDY